MADNTDNNLDELKQEIEAAIYECKARGLSYTQTDKYLSLQFASRYGGQIRHLTRPMMREINKQLKIKQGEEYLNQVAAPVKHTKPKEQSTLETIAKIERISEVTRQDKCVSPVLEQCGKDVALIVGLPDMHIPYSDLSPLAPSAKAALRWCAHNKPDEIVLMGDYMGLDCISPWNVKMLKTVESKRLSIDMQYANKILDYIQDITPKTTYLLGNHEYWLDKLVELNPQALDGIISIEEQLRLTDRKIQLVPENSPYEVGKATLIHGWYTNVYHARQTVDSSMDNIFYGHTHDIQSHSKTRRTGGDPIIGHSCGCLCDQNPAFMRNKPNKWAAAFLILYVDTKTGHFTYYVPQIINGRFYWDGKEYSA